MRAIHCLLAALLVLALVTMPAAGAPDATEPAAKKKPKLSGYHAGLARRAQFSDAQRDELVELWAELRARWEKEYEPELGEVRAQLAEAVEKGDDAAAKSLRKRRAERLAMWRQVERDFHTEVRALLSAEQQAQWQAGRMVHGLKISLGMRKVKLDDDQAEQIEPLCLAAGKKSLSIAGTDHKQRRALWQELKAEVIKDVLTPEQRALMAEKSSPQEAKPAPAQAASDG